MSFRNSKTRCWLPAVLACCRTAGNGVGRGGIAGSRYCCGVRPRRPTSSDQAASGATAPAAKRPKYEVAERSEAAAKATSVAPQLGPGQPNEHPLMPVLRWAYAGLGDLEKIQDYSATVAKRERIGGKLLDYEYMYVKLRQKPFSVYMYFLGPPDLKGQEVIYVEGRNNGNMWAHGVGIEEHHVRHRLPAAHRRDRHEEPALSADGTGHPQLDQPAGRGGREGQELRRVRREVLQRGQDQRPRLHLHRSRPPGAPAELPLPPGAGSSSTMS